MSSSLEEEVMLLDNDSQAAEQVDIFHPWVLITLNDDTQVYAPKDIDQNNLDETERTAFYSSLITGESVWEKPPSKNIWSIVEERDSTSDHVFMKAKNIETGEDVLATVWEEYYSEENQTTYYFNNLTGTSHWDAPEWVDMLDSRSQSFIYFVNMISGETSWTVPKNFNYLYEYQVPANLGVPLSLRLKTEDTNNYHTYDVEEKETIIEENPFGTITSLSLPSEILKKRESDADLQKIDNTVTKKVAVSSVAEPSDEMSEASEANAEDDVELIDVPGAKDPANVCVDSTPETDMHNSPPDPPRQLDFEIIESENSYHISAGAEPPKPPPSTEDS